MKKNHIGTIESIKEINKNVYSISFSSPNLADIRPGEYVSILCDGLTLRRPFSVADFKNGIVTVLFKKRGKGTEYLSGLETGNEITFSAPLGNTFKIENKKTLLIGAGIGIAPLFYLKKELKDKGADTYLAAGFLTKNDIISFDKIDFISTDDGSNGVQGSICDHLNSLYEEFKPEKIVSCAPHPVLEYVANFARSKNIECEVAMEKVMACGIGICRGCVIKIKNGNDTVNKTVCNDGPVFDAAEVIW